MNRYMDDGPDHDPHGIIDRHIAELERALEAEERRAEGAEAQVDRLRDALKDALEGLEEMLPYVDDYFVKKWKLADYATNAKAALQ